MGVLTTAVLVVVAALIAFILIAYFALTVFFKVENPLQEILCRTGAVAIVDALLGPLTAIGGRALAYSICGFV